MSWRRRWTPCGTNERVQPNSFDDERFHSLKGRTGLWTVTLLWSCGALLGVCSEGRGGGVATRRLGRDVRCGVAAPGSATSRSFLMNNTRLCYLSILYFDHTSFITHSQNDEITPARNNFDRGRPSCRKIRFVDVDR
eukprot:84968-Pleurochrysis_carterae.AAC.3